MVYCPLFLKRKKQKGFSLSEVLVILAILGILLVVLFMRINPQLQLGKARDAKRKSDLQKLTRVLGDYYNDRNCYPADLDDLVSDYVSSVPKDPLTKQDYTYSPNNPDVCSNAYRLYALLEYEEDPDIIRVGCQYGCGPGGDYRYNYGVTSTNTRLEAASGPTPTPTPVECAWYACSEGRCNSVREEFPGQKFCNDPCCGGSCCGPISCPANPAWCTRSPE